MFRIEELLDLFRDDTEVIKIILSSYLLSQRENKELSDSVFQQLLLLKQIQPNIHIKINYKSSENSNYNPNENIIYLNGYFDETTFFHELTHLFSYCYSKFEIPQEYKDFKKKFHSSQMNHSRIISFLNLCKAEKQKIIKNAVPLELEKNEINQYLSNNDLQSDNDYFIICKIEDIIDSIYGGESYDRGLMYLKDNNSYLQKAPRSAGHGCDYFNKNGYDFEEIIADYQTIKMLAPNNQIFILLKQILGNKFVAFLEDRCEIINGKKVFGLDSNNNIIKK